MNDISQRPATGDGELKRLLEQFRAAALDYTTAARLRNAEEAIHSHVSAAVQEAIERLKFEVFSLMCGCGVKTVQYEEDGETLLHAYDCGDDHHLCQSCQSKLDALVKEAT